MSRTRKSLLLVAAVVAAILTTAPAAQAEMIGGSFAWNPPPYAPGTQSGTSFRAVLPGPAGSVYVVGAYNATFSASGIVARVNGATGAKLWARMTKGPGGGGVFWRDASPDAAGNVVAVGIGDASLRPRFGLAKYGSSGDAKWSRWLSGRGEGLDVAIGPSSTVYAVGTVGRSGRGADGLLVKYAADGSLRWKSYLSTTRADGLTEVAVDARGNAYALGERNATRTTHPLALVKVTTAQDGLGEDDRLDRGVVRSGRCPADDGRRRRRGAQKFRR